MTNDPTQRSAVVADRRPLERGLVRFLLEEQGLAVRGEAGTMPDVLLQIRLHQPDVLVLHEKLAHEHDAAAIAQIRRLSPGTSIVLLAASRVDLPADLLLMVDSVVEDGPGLSQLGIAVARSTPGTAAALAAVEVVGRQGEGPSPALPRAAEAEGSGKVYILDAAGPPRASRERWIERIQGMAVASVILLAALIAVGLVGPGVPTREPRSEDAREHLELAYSTLETLREALPEAPDEQVAMLARALLVERGLANDAGADTRALDRMMREVLGPLLPLLPDESEALVVGILGSLVTDDEIPPLDTPSPPVPTSPAETPAPSAGPSEGPPPSPSAPPAAATTTEPVAAPPSSTPEPTTTHVIEPSPTEPPSQSPTSTEAPSPTEEPTPSASPSETPAPTGSEAPSPPPTSTETAPPPTGTETPSPAGTASPAAPSPSVDHTEEPSPSVDPTEEPSPSVDPTEEPSPSVDPTEEPSPGHPSPPHPTPSHPTPPDTRPPGSDEQTTAGSLVAVPPGIVLLLTAISGIARARRSDRRRPGRL